MPTESLDLARMSGLSLAIETIAAAPTLAALIDAVRSSTRKLIGADGITIVLKDGDYCHYVDEDAIEPLWKGERFPAVSCISGWVMFRGRTAVIPDIDLDERIPHDLYRGTFVRSLVMTPLSTVEPIGAIGAYWSETWQPGNVATAILEVVARFAGAAISKIQLIESLRKQMPAPPELH